MWVTLRQRQKCWICCKERIFLSVCSILPQRSVLVGAGARIVTRQQNTFFDLCPQVSVTPNLIVFTCLIGAYKTAPLEDLTSAYHAMRVLKIAPDTPFTETYLISVLQGDKTIKWDNPEITVNSLRNKPIERLQAARRALADFQRDGVQLTKMSR